MQGCVTQESGISWTKDIVNGERWSGWWVARHAASGEMLGKVHRKGDVWEWEDNEWVYGVADSRHAAGQELLRLAIDRENVKVSAALDLILSDNGY